MTLIWAVAASFLAGAFVQERHGSILAASLLCGFLFAYDLARDILTTITKGKGNGQ